MTIDETASTTASEARRAAVERTTGETQLRVRVDLDGTGVCQARTGLGFGFRASSISWKSSNRLCGSRVVLSSFA